MSRIGKKPIPIPKGVTVKIAPDAVEVQGPKGKMFRMIRAASENWDGSDPVRPFPDLTRL